jgi:hypothetical protein
MGIGAATVQAIHAQAKPSVYFIFENELTNPEAYAKEYLPEAVATIKAHGGRVRAAGRRRHMPASRRRMPSAF